jgi:DNA (cytosine-5)-methyltransferase 1
MPKPLYIDVFAGCGGLSTGMYRAGWHGVFAVEKNEDAFLTLKYNLIDKKHHFSWPKWLPKEACDINVLLKEHATNLTAFQGRVMLVAGGPPCQGFSMAGKRSHYDERNNLVKSYIKFIRLVRPEAIMFENVHGFTVEFKEKKGTRKYSSYVERALRNEGYKVYPQIIDMSEYGIPQNRKRFILIAMLNHNPKKVFELLQQHKQSFLAEKGLNENITVLEAIGDLEKANGTEPSPDTKGFEAGVYGQKRSGYQKLMRYKLLSKNRIPDSHRFVNHRQETIELHQNLLERAPVGRRVSPDDECVANLNRRGVTVLDPSGQAPTLTSIPDEMVHYREPRILTVREHARLQSFPDWFEFKGKYTSGGIRRTQEVPRYTQVGNAVPPLFAEQIGRALLEVLLDHE